MRERSLLERKVVEAVELMMGSRTASLEVKETLHDSINHKSFNTMQVKPGHGTKVKAYPVTGNVKFEN